MLRLRHVSIPLLALVFLACLVPAGKPIAALQYLALGFPLGLDYSGAMFQSFLLVALGGAFGASLRYGVGLAFVPLGGHTGAWATLLVNVVGSFALGLLSAWGLTRSVSASLWLFLAVGALGAFTTYSTFSRETMMMFLEGAVLRGLAYAIANLIGAVGAFAIGFEVLRRGLS